jgi:drug/metabolite transporter (DMT)-like permease
MAKVSRLAVIKATLTVIFWGSSFIATKIALQEISPFTVIWLRFAMGWAVLGVAAYLRHQLNLPEKSALGYLALLGFLGITFHQWLQSTGLVTSQASTTAWIVASTPIFIALLGWAGLREQLDLVDLLGILLAAVGVICVVTQGNFSLLLQGSFGVPGDRLILISALNWAIFSVLSRHGLRDFPPAQMMFYVIGFGWLFLSLPFILTQGYQEMALLTVKGWLSLGFLGLFCSGLAYIFWYDALKVMPASRLGVFLYLEPIVAVFLAQGMLAEKIRLVSLLGGGMILFGVWLVNRSRGTLEESMGNSSASPQRT